MRKKQPIRLLIIDDERDLLDSLKQLLELKGFEVVVCLNAEQSFKALENAHFDLVLTDIEMPVKSGIDLIATLREGMGLNIPIVIMTGKAKFDYLVDAIKLGASDYIAKPIQFSNLIELINRQINKSKTRNLDFDLKHTVSYFKKKYVFYPEEFFHYSITNFLNSEIQTNLNINATKRNDICLILEEAISNAFLHGIWKLSAEDRLLDRDKLVKITNKKTEDLRSNSYQSQVVVEIEYTDATHLLTLTITDTGTGFDYHRFVSDDDIHIDHKGFSGRGLFLIKALSDMIAFQNDGTILQITLNA